MKRIAILGRGGAGKSTLASYLATRYKLPVFELDQYFWDEDLTPTPVDQWNVIHQQIISEPEWIIDGDLGVYDTKLLERLKAADTVILLDFSARVCGMRALRRSPENLEFWKWVLRYRRDSLPRIMAACAHPEVQARIYRFCTPAELDNFLENLRQREYWAEFWEGYREQPEDL